MFGSKKFQKGMEAGARPFEAKFAQHADALRRLEQNFGKQWKETKDVADKILAQVESNERFRIYGLDSQIDIKELKQEFKDILIAAIYTLSSNINNGLGQSYIRSVQNYLGIKAPQLSIEFDSLENIENLTAQKAIFQSCVEYLLLAYGNPDFFDKYGDTLFTHFAITEKAMLEIWENVLKIYTATGPLGLAEKYGFVPESGKDNVGTAKTVRLEDEVIANILSIPDGEVKKFSAKIIKLNADIQCAGELVFEHCVFIYNGDDIKGHIILEQRASLEMINCTIIGKNNKKKRESYYDKYLIESQNNISKLEIKNTLFFDCLNFSKNSEIKLFNCIIRYSTLVPGYKQLFNCYNSFNHDSTADNCLFESLREQETLVLMECHRHFPSLYSIEDSAIFEHFNVSSWEEFEKKTSITKVIMFEYIINGASSLCNRFAKISNCSFRNINTCIEGIESVIQCDFHNCISAIKSEFYNKNELQVVNCNFYNCNDIICYEEHGLAMQNCQFLYCANDIVDTSTAFNTAVDIVSCQFFNIYCGNIKAGYFDQKYGKSSIISKCLFDGIKVLKNNDFITVEVKKDLGIKVIVEDCDFKHCETEHPDCKIIECRPFYPTLWNPKRATAIEVRNCRGLENVNREGELTDDIEIKQETSTGKPIGSRLDVNEVGVPGHNIESLLGD